MDVFGARVESAHARRPKRGPVSRIEKPDMGGASPVFWRTGPKHARPDLALSGFESGGGPGRLCYPRFVRVLLVLLLLAVSIPAKDDKLHKGKLIEDELPAESKRDDPLHFATYVATTVKADKPAKLILAVHAGTGSAKQFVGFLRSLAEAQGAILIGPRGLREIVGDEGWWWKGDRKEREALDRLLEHAKKKYNVDEKKITAVGLADGAELLVQWAFSGKGRAKELQGLILLNFLWKHSGSLSAAKDMKTVLFACREAKEKSQWLAKHAGKAELAFKRAKAPCVVRIMPGASRSFFHGWEKEFRKAYQWFEGKLDWPAELAMPGIDDR
jgi:predicted esterase